MYFCSLLLSTFVFAGQYEVPLQGKNKILLSGFEAQVSIIAQSSAQEKIIFDAAAEDDYQIETSGEQILIKEKSSKSKSKAKIEIIGSSLPLQVHLFEGSVQLQKWAKDALLHIQNGKVLVKEGSGITQIHMQKGEAQVFNQQGKVKTDLFQASLIIKNMNGDLDLHSFLGSINLETVNGFISLNNNQGTSKLLSGSGTLQFDTVKGIFTSQNFEGRIEGQSQEGSLSFNLAKEGDLNVRSQAGKIVINSAANSGALLNIVAVEGEIWGPNYLKVSRESSQKTLRGRLKGDGQKGTIVVRTQEGSVSIR